MVQKSGGGQVGNLPAFGERGHRGKKTFPMKVLDLPGLNFALGQQPGFCNLGVDNGGITAECSGEGWVGKDMAEEVMASPLPLAAEVELTPGSY